MSSRLLWPITFLAIIGVCPRSAIAQNTDSFDLYITNGHQANQAADFVELGTDCTVTSLGTYATVTPPTNGVIGSKTVKQAYYPQEGNFCVGAVVDTNSLQYAWTSSLTGQFPTDNFNMSWSTPNSFAPLNFTVMVQLFPRIQNMNLTKNSDVTYTTNHAIVGQPVSLDGSAEGYGSSPYWTIPGTFIGPSGFNPTKSSAPGIQNIVCNASVYCPGTIDLAQNELELYWTSPVSSPNTLTYSTTQAPPNILSQTTQVIASSTVKFTVSGPTVTGPTFTSLRPLGVQTLSDGTQYMGWGTEFQNGVQISVAVTPPTGYNGTVYWYSVITRDKDVRYTDASTSQIYSCSTGYDSPLDSVAPLPGATFVDGPSILLSGNANNYYRISTTREFQTYLMWEPDIGNSPSDGQPPTPIPLGYVTWGFTADATKTVQSDGSIVWQNTPAASGGVNAPSTESFTASTAYPQWNQVVIPGSSYLTCSKV